MVRILNIHAPFAVVALVLADIAIAYFAITVGLYSSYAPGDLIHNLLGSNFLVEKSLFVAFLLIAFFSVGVYYKRFLTDMKLGFLALAISHLLALGQLALVFYILPEYRIWISALAPALGLSFFGVLAAHVGFDRLVGVKLFEKKIVILGSGELAQRACRTVEHSPYLRCAACIPTKSTNRISQADLCERPCSLIEFVKSVGADEIVVAVADRRDRIPTQELLDCRVYGIQVSEFTSFVERIDGRVDIESLKPSWLIYSKGYAGALPIHRNLKRLIDVVLSAVLLIVHLPVIVLACVAIKIESPGPVFYCQSRIGAGGRPFRLWKLRSMRNDAEADGVARWSSPNDPRITRVGAVLRRLRIDELPQMFNVLLGDMSFVGPRPERPEFVEKLAETVPFYNYRHSVKPGITGWAQLQYPYGSSIEDAIEKLKYDLYYIKNGNLALDFVVYLQTLRVIIWPDIGTRERETTPAQLDLPGRPVGFFDSAP